MANFYDILGVRRDASPLDIRRAFRLEAKRLHPDAMGGTAVEMVRLNEAYETLKDPAKREAYDETLKRSSYRLPHRPRQSAVSTDPYEFKARVLLPLDAQLRTAMRAMDKAVVEVAYDIYDDAYLAKFGRMVSVTKTALALAHQRLFSVPWPNPIVSALNLYRQGIRQADDAVDDFEVFMLTLDADHLADGRSLLSLAESMLEEARVSLQIG